MNLSPSTSSTAVRLRRAGALLPMAGLVFSVLAGCKQSEHHAADVWATVNGTEIKRDEVEKYYRSQVNPEGQEPSQEEALSLKLNVTDQLINNEILLERAKKLNLEASDGEVEDKFTELKSPFTEDEFQRQLKARGMSVDDLKRDLRRQLSIQKLLNREVAAKITITDQDVLDFYNTNRNQFNIAEPRYRISQIMIAPRKELQVRNRKHSHPEAGGTRSRRTARRGRSAGAADCPRHPSQPQGTVVALSVPGDRARRSQGDELSGAASGGNFR